jgi:TolB-like protein
MGKIWCYCSCRQQESKTLGRLFSELKRRNVVRVGIAYVVLAWVALQVGDVLFDMFETPAWVGKTLAGILVLGFPFVLIFAWAFELTPEGVMRTEEVDRSESITHSTGRTLNYVIIAALVVAVGYFVWERQHLVEPGMDADIIADKSIAVLPFVNMSSDEEQEWFADGLTEEILNSLARTPDLLVASRTSSFQYKGRNQDISAIAKALGVAHILEGSVRRGGDRLRVTAQLIRASDGFHLWSETFDREPKDVIEIQENVAIEIANALKTAMDPEALQQMVSTGTASVAAYEAYLQGLTHEARSGASGAPEGWDDALAAYERATTIDNKFALAFWAKALYWEGQTDLTTIGSDLEEVSLEDALANYFEAIDAAIANEENEALALKFRANKASNELRVADAVNLYEAYVEQYPNDIEGMLQLTEALSNTRERDRARAHIQRMVDFSRDDPLQLNALINNILFVGLVDEAVALARDVIRRYPQHAFLLYQSHRVLLWAGHTEEAAKLVPILLASEFPEENIRLVLLRQACAEGDNEAAAEHFAKAVEAFDSDPSIHYIALMIMGRPDEAHQLLVDAKLGNRSLMGFLNYPYFDHTRFPEFADILEKQGVRRPFVETPPYACKADQI